VQSAFYDNYRYIIEPDHHVKTMKAYLKTVVLGEIAAVGTITFGGAEAHATTVKATVTADNFYGILYGNKDGSQLNFVGRNETGSTLVMQKTF
jgi:hypothetical protein